MKAGGTGGARTNETGLAFEKNTLLSEALPTAGYEISESGEIFSDGIAVGVLLPKHHLRYWLKEKYNVDMTDRLSVRLVPDEAVYVYDTQTMHIIEKKWQQGDGSADEKLGTSAFKIRQYSTLFDGLGIIVKYHFLLNSWFRQEKYLDVLQWNESMGVGVHFDKLELDFLKAERLSVSA